MIRFNILCPATNQVITLPVTPSSYSVGFGKRIESVTLYGLGDYNLQGGTTRATIKVEAMFPADGKDYPFAIQTSKTQAYFINMLKTWAVGKAVLRLIITSTTINLPVLLENIEVGEQDGTGDVYATLTFRNYVELQVPTFYVESAIASSGTAAAAATDTKKDGSRTTDADPEHVDEHTVAAGDTLSGICLKYYGDASLYSKLAAYNSIANPDLIYDGSKIKIPDKSKL